MIDRTNSQQWIRRHGLARRSAKQKGSRLDSHPEKAVFRMRRKRRFKE